MLAAKQVISDAINVFDTAMLLCNASNRYSNQISDTEMPLRNYRYGNWIFVSELGTLWNKKAKSGRERGRAFRHTFLHAAQIFDFCVRSLYII
jgi:hypothetical protein